MKRIYTLLPALLSSVCLSFSQPVLTRTGSYLYAVPEYQNFNEARSTALEKAKIKILEDEFGTVVGVSNVSRSTTIDGESSTSFLSVGQTDVKGEWVKTVKEPIFESILKDNKVFIKVTVTGQIREFSASSVEIDAKILRNGTDKRYESDSFIDGDKVFVYFKSPASGYVAVYQYDSDGVFRLLPYRDSELSSIPVKAGKEYVFFEQSATEGISLCLDISGEGPVQSNYLISCNLPQDVCRYYIIFSPKSFTIANDNKVGADMPAMIDFGAFNKWLGKARTQDRSMVVAIKTLTLKKKMNCL